MLYLDHDFYSNFNSGINSGDNELISDMLIYEISELIVYRSDSLMKLLHNVGIKVNQKASDEKIVDSILNNIPKNIKLIKGLSFLIAENNDARKTVKVVKGKDQVERKVIRNSRGAKKEELDMIVDGIVGIGDSFTYKPQLKKEFKLKLMKVIQTKSKAVGDRKRKHTNNDNSKYYLLALLVIGAGVAYYFSTKNKKKIAEEGLLIDGAGKTVAPSPPIEPTTPQPNIGVQPEVAPNVVQPQPEITPVNGQ